MTPDAPISDGYNKTVEYFIKECGYSRGKARRAADAIARKELKKFLKKNKPTQKFDFSEENQ